MQNRLARLIVVGVGQGGAKAVFTQYLLSARPTPDVSLPIALRGNLRVGGAGASPQVHDSLLPAPPTPTTIRTTFQRTHKTT